MRPFPTSTAPIAAGLLLGLCLFLQACAPAVDATESREALKRGLLALDQGNESAARAELEASLRADPKNSKARTALASIEATHAGVSLKAWLDPLLEAGKQMDSKLKTYRNTSDSVAQVTEAAQDSSDQDAMAQAQAQARDQENAGDGLKKKIRGVHASVGKAAVGAIILTDIFHSVPYLKQEQVEGLDRAIQILREESSDPEQRSEDVKVYLSVLSMVRLIHQTRSFVGNIDEEADKLFTSKSRFCQADSAEVKARIFAIRESISLLEESLRFATPPTEGPQKARYKLHRFVKKFLMGKDWENVELFFEKGSEQNRAAMRYFNRFCAQGTSNGQTGGADLFDPDAE